MQALSTQLQKYVHTQGGKEGGKGSRTIFLSSTISLCQLTLFLEFQLSPDNSTVCQIDSSAPDTGKAHSGVSLPKVIHQLCTENGNRTFSPCTYILPLPPQHLSGAAFSLRMAV